MDGDELLEALLNPNVGIPHIRISTVNYGLNVAKSMDNHESRNDKKNEGIDNDEYAKEYRMREEKMYLEYQNKTEVTSGTGDISVCLK